MGRIWILAFGLAGALACGSTAPETKAPTPEQSPPEPAPISASEPPPPTPTEATEPAPEPPPISIPNGRLYNGYVVGGLPSAVQFDEATAAGFDSAMSLMANEEDGIGEIARYASSMGVRYIRFTIEGKDDLNESMAWQFASTLAMLGRPAIIHSADGERVGAIFALMAFFVDDVPAQEALTLGRSAGMGNLEEHVRSIISP